MGAPPLKPGYLGPKPKRKRKLTPWLLWIIPLGIFTYLSTRPVMRLRDQPPGDFIEDRPGWSTERRRAEEHLARAYWGCAASTIQHVHLYGSNLPEQPPPEFTTEQKGWEGKGAETSLVVRLRYWQKLRKVWASPEAWQKTYGWNTDWFGSALISFRENAGEWVGRLLRRLRP